MWAMVVKEFRQLRRDRRTVAMMVLLPVLLLVVFGYAASFDVHDIPTVVVGPAAAVAAAHLHEPFRVVAVHAGGTLATATAALRDGSAVVGIVTGGRHPVVLMDGTQPFSVQTAEAALLRARSGGGAFAAASIGAAVRILFDPTLRTSWIMVPGIAGLILVFIGTLVTSLGVVRERQAGTLEQLAVMPFRAADVIAGKIAPYFIVAAVDLGITLGVGMGLFGVPFRGDVALFALGAVLFLLVTLGFGVLISTVSENQGQAIQLAIMFVLPQVLLSGFVFPLSSMAPGVRWISWFLPLTYFVEISRGAMLKAAPAASLLRPLGLLGLLGVVVFSLALVRFRRELAPGSPRRGSLSGEAAIP